MDSSLDRAFGGLVRTRREGLGMSQLELARRLGCPQSNVSRLESGRRSPTLRELVGLAAGLRAPLSDLLRDLETTLGKSAEAHSKVAEPAVPYGSVPAFPEAPVSEDAVAAQLAAHGVRFLEKTPRPAVFKLTLEETLLAALRFADEPRLFEALPALVLSNALTLDWSRLAAAAMMQRRQNRLGMVVAAALQLKKASGAPADAWPVLEEVHARLAEARLDREEVLGPKPRTREAMEDLSRRTPSWLKAWHAVGSVDAASFGRHLPK